MVLVGINARPLAPGDFWGDSFSSSSSSKSAALGMDAYPESERLSPAAVDGRESGL